VATWDDVRRIALALPETSEQRSHEHASWRVRDKGFVWERPLRPADIQALGDAAPAGPILGARVEHLGAKEALLADDPGEAWLARAPKRVAKEYLETRLDAPGGG
jgi:hypothetical protein